VQVEVVVGRGEGPAGHQLMVVMVGVVVGRRRHAPRRRGDRGGGGEHERGVAPYGGRDVRLGRRHQRHSTRAANYWRCYHESLLTAQSVRRVSIVNCGKKYYAQVVEM
jgi:hypothetical protein